MDIYAVIFVLTLLAIGLALITVFSTDPTGTDEAPEDEGRSLRQQALREERRMQRRRWHIWHKIDELHALFNEQAAAAESTDMALSPVPARPHARGPQNDSDFAVPDLQASYELFLREDFLKAGTAPTARRE
jgi:hypothetical protein